MADDDVTGADSFNAGRSGLRPRSYRTLLDPYAAAVSDLSPGSHGRCVVADQRFDWADDAPLRHSWSESILYETHVRGLAIDPSFRGPRRSTSCVWSRRYRPTARCWR